MPLSTTPNQDDPHDALKSITCGPYCSYCDRVIPSDALEPVVMYATHSDTPDTHTPWQPRFLYCTQCRGHAGSLLKIGRQICADEPTLTAYQYGSETHSTQDIGQIQRGALVFGTWYNYRVSDISVVEQTYIGLIHIPQRDT